jgi:hypothetical protein
MTDYIKIKELALKEKKIKAIGKWFDETIKNTYVKSTCRISWTQLVKIIFYIL